MEQLPKERRHQARWDTERQHINFKDQVTNTTCHRSVFGNRWSYIYTWVSVVYKSDYKRIRGINYKHQENCLQNKLLLYKEQSVKNAKPPHKTVDLHFSRFFLLTRFVRDTLLLLSISTSQGLKVLFSAEEIETSFHAKYQVLPVTYSLATTFHLPLSMGFHLFAQLPPSHHCIWFYEISPHDTVLCLPYIYLVLSTTWTSVSSLSEDQYSDCTRNTDRDNTSSMFGGIEMPDSSSLS